MKTAWVATTFRFGPEAKTVIGIYSRRKKGKKAIQKWIEVLNLGEQKVNTDSTNKTKIGFFHGEELIATLDRYKIK